MNKESECAKHIWVTVTYHNNVGKVKSIICCLECSVLKDSQQLNPLTVKQIENIRNAVKEL